MQHRHRAIRIRTLIDGLPLQGLLLRVPLLCVILLLTEGIDTFGVGFVGPFLSKAYGIDAQQLGFVYTGTVVASLLGATVVAPASDRFGRRSVLLLTSMFAAIGTLLTPLARDVATLFVVRFLVGLAFGAALPCAITLAADYAPDRRRNAVLLMMNTGINVGMMLAGLMAATIVPAFGWRALLYASAGLSIAASLVAWAALPESPFYLARRDPRGRAVLAILRALDPALRQVSDLSAEAEPLAARPGSPLALFQGGRALRTCLLWLLMSFSYVLINFNSYWMPTTILDNGASMEQTGLIVSGGKFGGILGAFAIGWLADRRGLPPILTLCLLAIAVMISLTGFSVGHPYVAILCLTLTCVLLNPNTGGAQTLTVSSYPGELRSVATGWVTGFARLIGGGAGTLLGAYMIQNRWAADQMANTLAVVPLLACLTVILLRRLDHRGGPGMIANPRLVPT